MLVLSAFYLIGSAQIELKFKNKEWEDVKTPIVEFEISGHKRLVMIDSGSDISIIDSEKADKLSSDYNCGNISCAISTVNGQKEEKSMFYVVKIINIKQRFYTRDLSYINSIYEDSGFSIFCILGADWLLNRKAVIDYNRRVLILNK